jgi:flagellar biosynthesis protein FliQ
MSRPLPRSANNLLGLLLLPLLALSLLTGLAIWFISATSTAVSMTLVFFHAYAGLLSLPVLAIKLWAGVRSWRHRAAERRGGWAGHALTGALVAVVAVLYGSGLLMYANFTPGGNALYKQVHLWSAILATPLVTHHLYLYLRRALEVVGRGVAARREAGLRLGRGQFLYLGLAALLAWGGFRGTGRFLESLASEDPNDFPVTITAGGADEPDPETWRLLVTGDVEQPLEFSLEDFRKAALNRSTYSLDCVIGWSVVREWGGVPVMDVIRLARPRGEILSAVFRSTTGYEVVLTPEVLEEAGTMVTLEVEGVPLSTEHGFPARLMAPGVVGEKCVKWLAEIEVVTGTRSA